MSNHIKDFRQEQREECKKHFHCEYCEYHYQTPLPLRKGYESRCFLNDITNYVSWKEKYGMKRTREELEKRLKDLKQEYIETRNECYDRKLRRWKRDAPIMKLNEIARSIENVKINLNQLAQRGGSS